MKGVLAAACVGVMSLALAPSAGATVSCTVVGPNMTVTISAGGDTQVGLEHRTSDGAILVDGNTCGGLTATTTGQITVVEATTGIDSTVDIFLTDGLFQPGAGAEAGAAEIEINLDYGNSGGDDTLRVFGNAAAEDWALGAGGVNLNYVFEIGNEDADIVYVTGGDAGIESKEFSGGNGADQILADGLLGTGAQAGTPLRMFGGPGNDLLRGGSNQDSVNGGGDDDTLVGRGDSDSYFGEAGNDDFDGITDAGGGVDSANYQNAAGPVTVDLSLPDGPQNTVGDGIDDFQGNIAFLFGSAHADTLRGDAAGSIIFGRGGADVLEGGPISDQLFGEAGADVVRGGFGADVLNGGDGTSGNADPGDTVAYDVAGATAGITIAGLSGDTTPSTATGEQGTDTLRQFTGAIGTPFADTISGNALANTFTGGGGSDSLFALGGPDSLNGGPGMDSLVGGDGNDVFSGGADGDGLLGGAGADSGSGDAGSDTITGDDGDDNLGGGADSDVVTGGAGADTAKGDGGADTVDGGAGNDTADGGSENDTVNGGDENDVVHGGSEDDVVSGDAGNDQVFGDAGRDTLLGLAGIDKLFAKDKTKDARIHCGPGSNKKERARFDVSGKPAKRDPAPRSC